MPEEQDFINRSRAYVEEPWAKTRNVLPEDASPGLTIDSGDPIDHSDLSEGERARAAQAAISSAIAAIEKTLGLLYLDLYLHEHGAWVATEDVLMAAHKAKLRIELWAQNVHLAAQGIPGGSYTASPPDPQAAPGPPPATWGPSPTELAAFIIARTPPEGTAAAGEPEEDADATSDPVPDATTDAPPTSRPIGRIRIEMPPADMCPWGHRGIVPLDGGGRRMWCELCQEEFLAR